MMAATVTATPTHNANDPIMPATGVDLLFSYSATRSGRRLTRAAYGAALPIKGASRRDDPEGRP